MNSSNTAHSPVLLLTAISDEKRSLNPDKDNVVLTRGSYFFPEVVYYRFSFFDIDLLHICHGIE